MCLLVIAHRASARFPLVIAANRDEDYDRATHDAHYWSDAPDVLGGRDAVAGGSWLAVTRSGRFAAVTNLRAAEPRPKSRGKLVGDFVTSALPVRDFAVGIRPDEYAGFHLLVGEASGELAYVNPHGATLLEPGIHAMSNAPVGERWPKQEAADAEMRVGLQMDDPESLLLVLMQFLAASRGTESVESEVFIPGERYGTRSSTVIVVSGEKILFAEQSYARGGVPYSRNRLFKTELK